MHSLLRNKWKEEVKEQKQLSGGISRTSIRQRGRHYKFIDRWLKLA